jgi:hypothetical protein
MKTLQAAEVAVDADRVVDRAVEEKGRGTAA